MKTKIVSSVGLGLLAFMFTIALTFATVQGPRMLTRILHQNVGVAGEINPAIQPDLVEQFIQEHHIRLIGYTSLVIVLLLIILGFLTEKRGLSSLGAVALFLPTFGGFAVYMFFLAGVGILRALWLPFWGDWMKLGDIAYLPYMIIVAPFTLIRVHIGTTLAILLIGGGWLIFLLGTLTWFLAKYQGKGTVDFWLYRYSRHPQYLGWIVWSYGLMLLSSQTPIPLGGQNPGAGLPWAISSLVILCVALAEEMAMQRERGKEYEAYYASAPFLLPLPTFLSKLVSAPARILLRKERPENKRDLLVIFGVYLILIMLLSLPFILWDIPGYAGWGSWPYFPMRRH